MTEIALIKKVKSAKIMCIVLKYCVYMPVNREMRLIGNKLCPAHPVALPRVNNLHASVQPTGISIAALITLNISHYRFICMK